MKGEERKNTTEREKKSNWSSLISGAGIMVQLIWPSCSLRYGDRWVTDGCLTCNGSHSQRAA